MSASRASGDLLGLHYGRHNTHNMPVYRNLGGLPPKLTTPTQLRELDGDDAPYGADDTFVTVNFLMSESDLDTLDSLLLLKILKTKTVPSSNSQITSFSQGGRDAPVPFKKLIFWVDLNADKGDNVVVTPIGKGQNKNIFCDCISIRDCGMLGG